MASPIQIVLNPDNYLEARDAGGGGGRKDFFAHRDNAFRLHKAAVQEQLSSISDALLAQSDFDLGFVKVILQRDAWAKSHRPVAALFKEDRTPVVGGGDLGVMIVEARPSSLGQVADEVARAETETRTKFDENRQKDVPNPSARKSEVGAIESIELYGPSDRRNFSLKDAIPWLSDERTGGSYLVELFYMPPPKSEWDSLPPSRRKLFQNFFDGLKEFGFGLVLQQLAVNKQAMISIRLDTGGAPPVFRRHKPSTPGTKRPLPDFDSSSARHDKLLSYLDRHPLVRRIELPGLVERSVPMAGVNLGSSGTALLPKKPADRSFPKMGIIDGGVSPVLGDWVIDRWDVLADEDMDTSHGTFIGGLAAAGQILNGMECCPEPDGTELVDIAVFPKTNTSFATYYPEGLLQFFDEVDAAVADAKERHGTRIFNMSLNIRQPAAPDQYSQYAVRLDSLAETNNVLLFVSAGNTGPRDLRPEWSTDAATALADLATARNDALLKPAESARNITVAALNPPDHGSSVPFAPARYSCRGPGLRSGVKPDLAHVGGSGSQHAVHGHGLFSLLPDGTIIDGCGTSYASPQVAKTAAILDQTIEGEVSRETLIALLVHHAEMPKVLQSAPLEPVARHMVGFGMPPTATEILETGDHSITLVFASRVQKDQQINFSFAWPTSLVDAIGKCRGRAKLTLVSSPPLDGRFGSEFVRVNLNATLQQSEGDGKWKGRLEPAYLPKKRKGPAVEAELIEHDLKWSPVKVFGKRFPLGVGKSSNWRLNVEYLTRAGETMPSAGVPFTAILTISDLNEEEPVFNDMRQSLQALGTQISDIRTAARITPRV